MPNRAVWDSPSATKTPKVAFNLPALWVVPTISIFTQFFPARRAVLDLPSEVY